MPGITHPKNRNFLSLEHHKLLKIVFLVLIIAATAFLLYQYFAPLEKWVATIQKTIPFPYGLDYGEGPLLDQSVRLTNFENIYQTDLENPPYTITNYPPIFPALQAPFVWLFGPQLWYGRLISVISIVLTGLFISLIILKLTKNRIAALFGGLTFLILPYPFLWGTVSRVDSLALMLSIAGLYVLVADTEKKSYRFWAAVLLVTSVFTKQSYGLVAPFTAFLFLLKGKPRKQAFEFAGWMALMGLGFLLVLNIITNGGFFFHIFTANVNPFHWETVIHWKDEMMSHFSLFFWLGGLYIVGGIWRPVRQKAWWIVAPYFFTALLVSITVGKEGSYINYFFELSAGFSLLVGALIGLSGNKASYRWVQLAMLILLFFPITGAIQLTMDDYSLHHDGRMQREFGLINLEKLIDEVEGNVLADEYMSMVVTSGKPLMFQPFEYKMLTYGDLWDQTAFVESITNKEYDLILLFSPNGWDSRNGRWTPEQLAAIEENYRVHRRTAETYVFYPRP